MTNSVNLSEDVRCCYFCGNKFNKNRITDFTADGDAICPYCGVDSVVNFMPYAELKEMSITMFGSASAMK